MCVASWQLGLVQQKKELSLVLLTQVISACEAQIRKEKHVAGLLAPLVLHTEVRTKFPSLWSFDQTEGFFVVKVSKERRMQLEGDESYEHLAEQLVDSMLGFTKVMRHLSESGKPVVGHNCLIDLLRIFRQFESELPPNYELFKEKIHHLLPTIYDTKNICINVKKVVGRRQPKLEKLLASSNLNQLHKELTGNKQLAHAPRLLIPKGFSRYTAQEAAHEAGYDALLAGWWIFVPTVI